MNISRFDFELFKERLGFFAHHYSDEINTVLKWFATALTILGAVAVIYKHDPHSIYLLNGACVVWIAWGYRIKEWSILTVNIAMLAIYTWGMYIRL